ncbi:DoxX family protein [Neobacillus notoginsengisoli]|uniref:DoxX family protein n=1 Tax=Neobacillus notoginsengisoli TaxID=1578198 RepID=A0A417YLH3_9BACI|nr:DoxX family protein [Neobacillus notoginsengisoli]RHW34138.1 DoxX family protein [Neobacillus notoginsengisoli]
MINKFDASVLLLRVFLGISFFIHGFSKYQGGIENTAGWFASIGLPGNLAYVAATTELVGGVFLILGLGTRVVSVLLAIIMVGAIVKVKLAAGFLGNGQMAGYELDLAFLVMAVFLTINGSKLFSIDQLLSDKKEVAKNSSKAA